MVVVGKPISIKTNHKRTMPNLSELNKNHKEAVQKYIDEPRKWVAVNLHYLAVMDVLMDQQRGEHIQKDSNEKS